MTEDFIVWLKKNGHDRIAAILRKTASKSQMRRFTHQISEIEELWKEYRKDKEK